MAGRPAASPFAFRRRSFPAARAHTPRRRWTLSVSHTGERRAWSWTSTWRAPRCLLPQSSVSQHSRVKSDSYLSTQSLTVVSALTQFTHKRNGQNAVVARQRASRRRSGRARTHTHGKLPRAARGSGTSLRPARPLLPAGRLGLGRARRSRRGAADRGARLRCAARPRALRRRLGTGRLGRTTFESIAGVNLPSSRAPADAKRCAELHTRLAQLDAAAIAAAVGAAVHERDRAGANLIGPPLTARGPLLTSC